MTRARRLTADAMVGAGSVGTVLAGVSIMNPDIRGQISSAIGGDPGRQLASMASGALDLVHTVTRASGNYIPDGTPVLGFAILAVVLTVMMIRA